MVYISFLHIKKVAPEIWKIFGRFSLVFFHGYGGGFRNFRKSQKSQNFEIFEISENFEIHLRIHEKKPMKNGQKFSKFLEQLFLCVKNLYKPYKLIIYPMGCLTAPIRNMYDFGVVFSHFCLSCGL